MRLSTSQVASKYEAFMVYGPLTKDGYGCCYSPRDQDMFFGISSFKSCSETDSERFKKTLEECLQHMFELLSRAGEPIKSKL
jgi:carnitine O-acetyltransferase